MFCDTSEKGFAAVAYFKIAYVDNTIGVCFVANKRDTLETEYPNEEVLRTLFAKIGHIVNSRPSYYVSSDLCDPAAITPIHLLFGAFSRELHPERYELLGRVHERQ